MSGYITPTLRPPYPPAKPGAMPIGRPPVVGGPEPMPRPPIGRPPVVGGPEPMPRPPIGYPPVVRPPIGRPPVTNWPTTHLNVLAPVQRVELDTITVPVY